MRKALRLLAIAGAAPSTVFSCGIQAFRLTLSFGQGKTEQTRAPSQQPIPGKSLRYTNPDVHLSPISPVTFGSG